MNTVIGADSSGVVTAVVSLVIVVAACVVSEGATIVTVCVKPDLGIVATAGPLVGFASEGPQV
jgi:hypothetical protein